MIYWTISIFVCLSNKYRSVTISKAKVVILAVISILLFYLLMFSLPTGDGYLTLQQTVYLGALLNCSFISYFFLIAAAIVSAEKEQRNGINIFRLILQFMMFPIGVWYIQPRIQKLALETISKP